eukprot:scaffold4295_cov161-Ochromonas_danica.AAC.1
MNIIAFSLGFLFILSGVYPAISSSIHCPCSSKSREHYYFPIIDNNNSQHQPQQKQAGTVCVIVKGDTTGVRGSSSSSSSSGVDGGGYPPWLLSLNTTTSSSADSGTAYNLLFFDDLPSHYEDLCMIVVDFDDKSFDDILQQPRVLCPSQCHPVPHLHLYHTVLNLSVSTTSEGEGGLTALPRHHQGLALTCSLTLSMALSLFTTTSSSSSTTTTTTTTQPSLDQQQQQSQQQMRKKMTKKSSSSSYAWPIFLFQILIERRMQECYEEWILNTLATTKQSGSGSSRGSGRGSGVIPTIPRRKIAGLVIWIGNMKNYDLMEAQEKSLTGLPFHDYYTPSSSSSFSPSTNKDEAVAVLGWAASDTLYPCHSNHTRCSGSNKKYL